MIFDQCILCFILFNIIILQTKAGMKPAKLKIEVNIQDYYLEYSQ